MSALRRSARSLATYLLLVLPPVAGLLAVLHVGRDLTPPRSIGGHWRLELTAPAEARCTLAAVALEVEQSGPRARAALRGSGAPRSLSLRVDGDEVRGHSRPALDPCAGFALTARFSGRDELTGTLARPACPACAPVSFRAVREPEDARARR